MSKASISADVSSNDTTDVSEGTVSDYLQALRKLHVVENMDAWNPNLRSKTAIRTSCTSYFVDPHMAVASMRIGSQDLIRDIRTMGSFF